MKLDIKIPIGLLFALLGIIFTIYGLLTGNDPMYEKSLGHNVNLYVGLLMVVFGGFMLILARKSIKNLK